MSTASEAEPGCDVTGSPSRPRRPRDRLVFEEWADTESLEAHFASAALRRVRHELGAWVDGEVSAPATRSPRAAGLLTVTPGISSARREALSSAAHGGGPGLRHPRQSRHAPLPGVRSTMCTTNRRKSSRIFESEYIPVNKDRAVSAISTHTDVDFRRALATVLGGLRRCRVGHREEGREVAITDFASFDRWERKARTARNPRPVSPSRSRPPRLPASRLAPPSRRSSTGQAPPPRLKIQVLATAPRCGRCSARQTCGPTRAATCPASGGRRARLSRMPRRTRRVSLARSERPSTSCLGISAPSCRRRGSEQSECASKQGRRQPRHDGHASSLSTESTRSAR